MKDLLIIVHGASALKYENKLLQSSVSFIYKYIFNYTPRYSTRNLWLESFSKSDFDVLNLDWSGKVVPYDVPKASKSVRKIIEQNKNRDIYFLTESIGTEIVLRALDKLDSESLSIKKVVSICPVNRPREIRKFKMISLNSESDIFARFSKIVLWPFHFFKNMRGNVEVITFDGIRHDQFTPDFFVGVESLNMYDIIKNKLTY